MTAFNKALKYKTQNELLNNEKTPKTNNSPIFSIQYNNNTKYVAHILHKHWNVIDNDPTLRILWPEPPMVAYQKKIKASKAHWSQQNLKQLNLSQTVRNKKTTNQWH